MLRKQIGELLENDWVRGGLIFLLVLLLEIALGLVVMERVAAALEAGRKQEFVESWRHFLEQRQKIHESKVTGYAWWTALADAVRAGNRAFVLDNIGEDASLAADYDLLWLAGAGGATFFAAVDGADNRTDPLALETRRDQAADFAFLAFTTMEREKAAAVPIGQRVALKRPLVRHELREYAGRLRLVTVSPLCDTEGYPAAPGYFVFGYNIEKILRNAEEVIPVRLRLTTEPPADAYHVEPLAVEKAGTKKFYLVLEPRQYLSALTRGSLLVLIVAQVFLVLVTGFLTVPYFARRRGRRLKAEVADRTRQLEIARRAAEAEKEAAELSRRELAQLTDIARQINATRNLDEVLDQVFAYFLNEFGIEAVIVLLTDPARRDLFSYRTTEPRKASPSMIAFSRALRVALDTDGILQKALHRKRPFYLARIDARAFPPGSDREIIDALALRSFLLVPLVIRDEPIAMILFTSYEKQLRLSRPLIDHIAAFCDQVAGAVFHASLLRQVEEERARSEEARADAERSRAEIAQINEISRRLNSTVDLNQVLLGMREYFRENFNIDNLWLQLVDEKHREFYTYRVLTDEASEAIVDFLYTLRQPIGPEAGMVWHTYRRRRPFFLRRAGRGITAEADQVIIDTLQLKSSLQIPLLIRESVLGVLHVTSFQRYLTLRPRDIATINRFAQQIAGAVHTARLFEQAEISRIATEISRMNAERAQKKADGLLLNILPTRIAEELKERGEVTPLGYENVTVLFTDFINFTKISERMPPDELLRELDGCFSQFDDVCSRNHLEKLKTIGDAYMCAGGLPDPNRTHAVDACLAALEFQHFMDQMRDIKKSMGLDFWELRVGIHTGPLIAGVVGKKKFAYDIWGDTVNQASRMESHGAPSRVNISGATYERVRFFFDCEYRGKIDAKGKGLVDMYFVNGIHPRLSRDGGGLIPGDEFRALYSKLEAGARLVYRSEMPADE